MGTDKQPSDMPSVLQHATMTPLRWSLFLLGFKTPLTPGKCGCMRQGLMQQLPHDR